MVSPGKREICALAAVPAVPGWVYHDSNAESDGFSARRRREVARCAGLPGLQPHLKKRVMGLTAMCVPPGFSSTRSMAW